jgi:hypothetical protein
VECGKYQIPPDLVVKFQAIDIVEVIWDPINGKTSSKGRVATGNQEVSWSQHTRVIGLPLNRVECEKFFVRVDVTEEFPFLVTRLSPYYDR